MLGSPILYLKGMGILMFQVSGFYCKPSTYIKPSKNRSLQPTALKPESVNPKSLTLGVNRASWRAPCDVSVSELEFRGGALLSRFRFREGTVIKVQGG